MPLFALEAVALVALWSAVPWSTAHAYVDPSVMTYTIQAVAGLAVALSALIGVVFRRTRLKLYEIVGIDENAGKFDEGPVKRIDAGTPEASSLREAARRHAAELGAACDAQVEAAARDLPRSTRFAYALVVCIFFAFTVFIAPALEIFGSNGDSLVFGLGAVWWVPPLFCLPVAVMAASALSLLERKSFYTAVIALFALTIAAYVQSLALNGGMMPADGGYIGWTEPYFVIRMVASGIVWVLIVAAAVVLSRFRPHTWLKTTTALACVVAFVQLVGVGSVAFDAVQNGAADSNRPYVTKGSLLSVSPKSNVVVFVLDTYDTALLDAVLDEQPDFLADFDGFTYFHNSVGTMIPTANAIPNLLTQAKPAPEQDIAEYRRTKYQDSTFLGDIAANGYSIGLYSDSLMMDFGNQADRQIAAMTLNVHHVGDAPLDVLQTFICMEQCALYREAPWVLKPVFWYYTSDLNNRMIADGRGQNLDDSLYELDDAAILKLLRTQKLQATDAARSGAFRFIHLFGPHFPYNVDERGENIGTNRSDQLSQAKGSMRVVMEYLDQLKELGLYDEACIIVTADHGIWSLSDDPVQEPISPIMLAKPSYAPHGTIRYSNAPICHDDVQPTVMAAIRGNSGRYGLTLFDVGEQSRTRYFDALTNATGDDQRFVEYAIDGDVMDIANWEKTGNTWKDA